VAARAIVKRISTNGNKQKCYIIRAIVIQQYIRINNLCISLCLSILSLKITSTIHLVEVITSTAKFVEVVTSLSDVVEVVTSTRVFIEVATSTTRLAEVVTSTRVFIEVVTSSKFLSKL
jgi:hypothetical protein